MHQHQFICTDSKAPKPSSQRCIREYITEQDIVFTSNEMDMLNNAVIVGLGIGTMTVNQARKLRLVNIGPSLSDQHVDDWQVVNWFVTHGDLHCSEKVQDIAI